MVFFTVINCMDGRVQLPVIDYLKKRFGVEYVDTITEPGPNRILAGEQDSNQAQSILLRARISIDRHQSGGIAVVGHFDCAGNPGGKAEQIGQVHQSIQFLQGHFSDLKMIGLWVDSTWKVHEI
jgi:hypothetical protein